MLSMSCSVKLVSVSGDQEDFGDLIGTTGKLHLDGASRDREVNWYSATDGDVIALCRKRASEKDGTVRVVTQLGNTFTFEKMERGLCTG